MKREMKVLPSRRVLAPYLRERVGVMKREMKVGLRTLSLECCRDGLVECNGEVIIHSDGDFTCDFTVYVPWKVMAAACEMRKEWEETPRLPDGWEVTGNGDVATLYVIGYRRAVSIYRRRIHDVAVEDHATPAQCAQIPAALAYLLAKKESEDD